MDLIAGVWAPFSPGTIKNRSGGCWNRWSIPFFYCTIYPSSSSSSSYHQIVSNTIQNRGSSDDGPLNKMRIFNIPNYEEKEYRMKHTHAHNNTTISNSIHMMVIGGICRRDHEFHRLRTPPYGRCKWLVTSSVVGTEPIDIRSSTVNGSGRFLDTRILCLVVPERNNTALIHDDRFGSISTMV
jgi:hypothetical protein